EHLQAAGESLGIRGLTGFHERLQLHTPRLQDAVSQLRRIVAEGTSNSLEGDCALQDAILALIASDEGQAQESHISASKLSVRKDLFKRLNLARDFALCNLSNGISLDDLSQIASMSPFHFHRMHRQAFGETP